ncbi:MAG: helix-turn-helix transcriptional regulator [Candidatus Bathyarchaeota archaeon]|nr:MAG: helix-turn-helix transcriptional regulator [Candidatus Bathyarchaeota archaeon]
MRTTDLKNMILKLFGHKAFYGYEVHKALAIEGVELEISRLYRVLNEMRKEELLKSRWTKSRLGPKKRMYQLSEKGKAALHEIFLDAIRTVHSFYGLYLQSLTPKINVFAQLFQLLTNKLQDDETIVFISMDFTPMHEMIIQRLHNQVPHGKIVLVKPLSVAVDLNLDNLLFLDGFYNDIPLKDDYANCMIVIDLPSQKYLERTLKEWHRVLKPNGSLAILTPTILLTQYEDPLTIGDFIEKHEHETREKGEHVNKHILEQQMKTYFKKLEEKTLVHMTILRVSEPIQ